MSLFIIPASLFAKDTKDSRNEQIATEEEKETEVAWKIIVTQEDRFVEQTVADFVEQVKIPNESSEGKTAVVRLKKLLSQAAQELTTKDLMSLNSVRSIQITQYGTFVYPYFKCTFKSRKNDLFFEKTAGSQRKSGTLFANNKHTMIFLGAKTVNNEKQRQYSGINLNKNKEHDAAAVFLKRDNIVFAVFKKKNGFEVYEFR